MLGPWLPHARRARPPAPPPSRARARPRAPPTPCASPAGFHLEVCPLTLHFAVSELHEPQLAGLTLGIGMLVDGAGGAALEGALPLCVKEVPSTFDHLDWV